MSKMDTSTQFGMNNIPYRTFHISTWAAFCASGVVSFEIEIAFVGDSSMDTGLSVNNRRFKSKMYLQ